MTIWIVNPFDRLPGESGAPGRYALLSRALVAAGCRVVWWSSDFSHERKRKRNASDAQASAIAESGVDVRLTPTRRYRRNVSLMRILNHRDYARGLADRFRREPGGRPIIVLVSLPPLGALGSVLSYQSALGNPRVVVDVQDIWPDSFRVLAPPGKIWDAATRIATSRLRRRTGEQLSAATECIATCQRYLEWAKRLGGNGEQYFYLATRRRFGDEPPEEGSSRPVRFVYSGAMGRVYDLSTLVEASHLLRGRGLSFRVELAGGGAQEPELRRLVGSYGLNDVVGFKGFLAEPAFSAWLTAADVGVVAMHPSSAVAMPNKAGDYLSAGLALLNTLPGELQQLIQANGCGMFYQAGSPESLAACMATYIEDPRQRVRHGKAARRVFQQAFDHENVYRNMAAWLIGSD